MNKTLVRIVALLLVPCLLADPSTVSAFTNALAPLGERVGVRGDFAARDQSRFEQEALSTAVLSSEHLYLLLKKVGTSFVSLGRRSGIAGLVWPSDANLKHPTRT